MRQNRTVAMGHYSDAAQQGVALAMLRLANLYAVGVVPGTPDFPKAWAYAKQADDIAQKSGNKADIDVTANVIKQLEDKMKDADKAEALKIYDKMPKPQAAGAAAPAAAPTPAPAPEAAPAKGGAPKKK